MSFPSPRSEEAKPPERTFSSLFCLPLRLGSPCSAQHAQRPRFDLHAHLPDLLPGNRNADRSGLRGNPPPPDPSPTLLWLGLASLPEVARGRLVGEECVRLPSFLLSLSFLFLHNSPPLPSFLPSCRAGSSLAATSRRKGSKLGRLNRRVGIAGAGLGWRFFLGGGGKVFCSPLLSMQQLEGGGKVERNRQKFANGLRLAKDEDRWIRRGGGRLSDGECPQRHQRAPVPLPRIPAWVKSSCLLKRAAADLSQAV